MKIWAKLVINHKNIKDVMYNSDLELTYNGYEIMLREVAELLDIATPLTMRIHYKHFVKFKFHKLKAADFVDTIDFDYLELENHSE